MGTQYQGLFDENDVSKIFKQLVENYSFPHINHKCKANKK